MKLSLILGIAGTMLTPDEHVFLSEHQPAGFILFARNLQDPQQTKALTDSLRALPGCTDIPILMDEEGGQVSRMKKFGPDFMFLSPQDIVPQALRVLPAPSFHGGAGSVGEGGAGADTVDLTLTPLLQGRAYLGDKDELSDGTVDWTPAHQECLVETSESVYRHYANIGMRMKALGVNVNCAPVLDTITDNTAAFLQSRCFGHHPQVIQMLGIAAIQGLHSQGIRAVVKHAPGHGLAQVDSHAILPVIQAESDSLKAHMDPFMTVLGATQDQQPWMMTAHLKIPCWDDEPVTFSKKIIHNIIRNDMNFSGILITDDLHMKALNGSLVERVAKALDAGHDYALVCHGTVRDWQDLAALCTKRSGSVL